MCPELIEIPFIHITVKSYGLMMVIGFILGVGVIRRLSRRITPDPQIITNAALYSLIAGVVGARLFFVIHYFDQFRGNLLGVFAIWHGGLELLGGVVLAIAVIFSYLWYHKLPMRQYLDVLAIGLMVALIFGRVGCFLNGCCYGKPSNLPWAVRFPYGSFAHRSQVRPDPERRRHEAHLELPPEYFGYQSKDGEWIDALKPKSLLTEEQRKLATEGAYRPLRVHPTQLYGSAGAAIVALLLYLFWRRSQRATEAGDFSVRFTRPGSTFAMMFVLYAIVRFNLEFVRDDNPFEIDSLTVSQLLAIGLIIVGVSLLVVFDRLRPPRPNPMRKTR